MFSILHRVFCRLLCSPPPSDDANDGDDADAEDDEEDEEEDEKEADAALSAWMTEIQVLRSSPAASAISAMACVPRFVTTFPTPAPLITATLTDSRLSFRRQLSALFTCFSSAGTVPSSSGIARVAFSRCFFKYSRRITLSFSAPSSRMAKGGDEEDGKEEEDEQVDEDDDAAADDDADNDEDIDENRLEPFNNPPLGMPFSSYTSQSSRETHPLSWYDEEEDNEGEEEDGEEEEEEEEEEEDEAEDDDDNKEGKEEEDKVNLSTSSSSSSPSPSPSSASSSLLSRSLESSSSAAS